jgi:site-specific DNA recombinase
VFYVGEVHHGGKWFEGEHEPIIGRQTFESVQELLKSNATGRKVKRSESGALLQGKLFDDKGNLMTPSFSTKNRVRYRFYVSSALLHGRKAEAGSVKRISAAEVESAVLAALQSHRKHAPYADEREPLGALERVVVTRSELVILTANPKGAGATRKLRVPWSAKAKDAETKVDGNVIEGNALNEGLIQSIVRAHAWTRSLQDGSHETVEILAKANNFHPKVIRQALRLAFLSPEVTSAILEGRQPADLSLGGIPKLLPLTWTEHQSLLV